jgi:hypothetical protein
MSKAKLSPHWIIANTRTYKFERRAFSLLSAVQPKETSMDHLRIMMEFCLHSSQECAALSQEIAALTTGSADSASEAGPSMS